MQESAHCPCCGAAEPDWDGRHATPEYWARDAEIVRLRTALEPFAAIGRRLNAVNEGVWPSDAKARFLNLDSINVGHFRQAGRVIEQTTTEKDRG